MSDNANSRSATYKARCNHGVGAPHYPCDFPGSSEVASSVYDRQIDAASGMLAVLKNVENYLTMSRPASIERRNQWEIVRDAIREAEAAGIVAADC